MAEDAAQRWGIEPALLKAHIQVESNWNPMASRYEAKLKDTSWGLVQILLATGKQVSGNPNLTAVELLTPETNLDIAAHYIAQQFSRYKGNYQDEMAAYNAGSAIRKPDGTYINQDYVNKVYEWYLYYKYKQQGLEITEPIISTPGLAAMLGLGVIIGVIVYATK